MKRHGLTRMIGVAALCASIGAAGGIAGASAKKSHKSKSTKSSQRQAHRGDRAPGGPGRPGGPGGFPVHEEAVVLNKAGTAFITATRDAGVVVSVSGNDITIKEGTDTVTYKTVTLTIPDGATISRNHETAKLSDFKAGDHVMVSQSSDGTFVFGGDESHGPGDGPHGQGGPPPGPPPA